MTLATIYVVFFPRSLSSISKSQSEEDAKATRALSPLCARGSVDEKVDVSTDAVLLHIPVTTEHDNLTYANVYCALCHGQTHFRFWEVEMAELELCFNGFLSGYLDINQPDNEVADDWPEQLRAMNCSMGGKVRASMHEELQRWSLVMYERNTTSTSRLSRFCLNENLYLKCDPTETVVASNCTDGYNNNDNDIIDNDNNNDNSIGLICSPGKVETDTSCVDGKRLTYQICKDKQYEACDFCGPGADPDADQKTGSCITRFSATFFHNFVGGKFRSPFSLRMFFEADTLKTSISMGGPSVVSHCPQRASRECSVDGGAACQGTQDRTTRNGSCFYPNAFSNKCMEYPCSFSQLHRSAEDQLVPRPNETVLSFETGPQPRPRERHPFWERFLSEKMLVVSMVCLGVTILLYLVVPELRTNFRYYQINCLATYLTSNCFTFVSNSVGAIQRLCVASAILLHFSLLSSFAWMMINAGFVLKSFHALNRRVGQAAQAAQADSRIFGTQRFFLSHLFGHVIPALFVLFCVVVDFWWQPGSVAYGPKPSSLSSSSGFCWIHDAKGQLMVFVVPTSALLLLNVVIFAGCAGFLLYFHWRNRLTAVFSVVHLRTVLALVKLFLGLGTQWLFGVLSHFYPDNAFVSRTFVLLVSIHGVMILLSTMFLKVVRRRAYGFVERTCEKVKSFVT